MNRNTKKKLIVVRYAFPVVAIVLTFLLMLVPCYSYTTAETGQTEAISLCELLDNSRLSTCDYLFEKTGTKDNATLSFSKTVLGLIVGLSILFALATAAAIYVLVSAIRYFRDPEDRSNARILFITLFPNRAVGFLWQLLVFPLLAFPHIMILLYKNILHTQVELSLTFPDPLILAALLYLIAILLSFVSTSHESGLHMNPFARRKPQTMDDGDEE